MAEEPVQRRLAAILAADVVGYSRLMGRDETGTFAALRALRAELIDPKIAEHKGRVFNSTGDGILAEFPSVVDAVASAVAIQRRMQARDTDPGGKGAIRLRIGVHVGDVIVEGDDLFGEGVNVAARLEGIAPPGGVAVSGTVRDHLGSRLDLRFEEGSEQRLKNIDRPVQVWRISLGPSTIANVPRANPGHAKPSIAVLPFTNMSSDPEQEFFADGLSEDLITDLSKVAGLFVIARHSSFVYKGRTVDIRQAAQELGVAYVVEGSVRRSASRVRITVQLIDAVRGGHIWADRFDRNLEDVFALQDEVVGRIVTALVDALPAARLPPKRRAPDIAAYDLFVRGRAMTLLTLPDPKRSARPLLEKAIELDPDFADAHAWLAMNLAFQWIDVAEIDERDTILAEAERAVSLDPDNADGYFVRGYALTYNGNLSAGREQFELALKSNPNHADAWLFLADLEVLDGHPDAALRSVDMAFQLNPYPHPTYYWLRGFALYAARRYEEAVAALQHKSCRETGAQRILAAALAQLGRYDEAREAVLRFLNTFPQFTAESWAKTQPFRKADDLQHFIDGYIKAGLPA